MKSDDLRRALRAIFTPDELMMPGWITYSGLDVLKNQMCGFYLMGLNPAVERLECPAGRLRPGTICYLERVY